MLKKILPHLTAFVLFIIIALAYFYPTLQGKHIYQGDIVQFNGMSRQVKEYRQQGEEMYWLDNAFVGMPAYQVSALYPNNYIRKIDRTLRFLPGPSGLLFMYFACMYVLLMVLKVDWRLAILGSLAFGLSTYLIIILGVGHNSKAHAISYMPLVLSGILLVFQRRYIIGFFVMTFAMGFTLVANHLQMTYYLLLLVLVIGVVYAWDAYKKKELPQYFKGLGVLLGAAILGVAMNATNLMATREYMAESTRGPSELTINPDGTSKERNTGMSKEYITEYSYGIIESFDLFIPRLMGGSGNENLGKDSEFLAYLRSMEDQQQAQQLYQYIRPYWGGQPIVAAPAYVGAVVIFLFVLALFLVRGPTKWWLALGALMALVLSWGKNIPILTNFLIDYFPLYDKFRAISSIQVILELCVPILAVLGLQVFFFGDKTRKLKEKALIKTSAIIGGLAVFFLLFGTTVLDFVSPYDPFRIEAMVEDRQRLFIEDAWRSFILVTLVALTLFTFLRKRIGIYPAIGILALLVGFDLVALDWDYVSDKDFVTARRWKTPFKASAADKEILKDTTHFRVLDPVGTMASSKASFFHNSVGGYHAAKPKRIQELYDFHLAGMDNVAVINMLNVKYVLLQNEKGQTYPATNPAANGNAWFVNELRVVATADEEMLALDSLDNKRIAIVNKAFLPTDIPRSYRIDSTARVTLTQYKPNHLVYRSNSSEEGLAVFSEMYYPHGWEATIDGASTSYFKVNYLLRGLVIPAGEHVIEFTFDPDVVKTGSALSLASGILVGLLLLFFGYKEWKRQKQI